MISAIAPVIGLFLCGYVGSGSALIGAVYAGLCVVVAEIVR